MERRSFIQKTALASTFALFVSPKTLFANEQNQASIDLSSIFANGKNIKLSGATLDAITQTEIAAKISVKSGSGIFSKFREVELIKGQYSINSRISSKANNKLKIKIEAKGYKTFKGNLYLTSNGCRIHSEMWAYYADFKPEYLPKNKVNENEIISKFNFHLIKA